MDSLNDTIMNFLIKRVNQGDRSIKLDDVVEIANRINTGMAIGKDYIVSLLGEFDFVKDITDKDVLVDGDEIIRRMSRSEKDKSDTVGDMATKQALDAF